jgi:RNA polymerase sigma-70 factor (ECF subfamily)
VDKLRRSQARRRASSLETAQVDTYRASADLSRLEQDERFGAILSRVNALPELQRMVVTRAYLGGQTLRQIGEELHTPIGTVKSALSRALLRLRERVNEEPVV